MNKTNTTYHAAALALENVAPLAVFDKAGNCVYVNALFQDTLGFLEIDFDQLSLKKLLDEPNEANNALLKSSLLNPWEQSVSFIHDKVFDVRWIPLKSDAEVELMLVLQSEVSVSKSQSKVLEAINDNLQVGLYRSTVSGSLLFANDGMAKIFGFKNADDLVRTNCSHLYLDPNTRSEIQGQLELKGKVENEEVLLRRKDGTIFWGLLFTTKTYDDFGNVIYDGAVLDISSFKACESQLKVEKRKAVEASKAKEQFLSTMSHELRTPMNAVIGMTYLLLNEQHTPEQAKSLKTLRFSAENLLSIINDILDFSKIEAGKLELEHVNFDFEGLMSNIHESFMIKSQDKGIQLELNLAPDVPKFLVGDSVRLSQILNNLVSNAVKFTYHGEVKIEVSVAKSNEATLRFSVSDTGIGIPRNKLNSIFQLFTQASSSITRKYGGTGLGLTITKRLIELSGGQLEVVSQPGYGSEFYFSIPFVCGEKEEMFSATGNEDVLENKLSGVSILAAEDNEVNQILLEKFLSSWGAEFKIVENGEDAVNEVKSQEYDLILMDLQMPVLDGYSATKEIRACKGERFQNIPIIAVTASVMLDVRNRALEVGMTDYIIKPYTPDQLFNKIRSTLNLATPVDE